MTAIDDRPARPRAARSLLAEAEAVSMALLDDVGTRWAHVRTAGAVARRLSILFDPDEAELLVAAATVHDIGYSGRIALTGFHSLDGALFLRQAGFPERLSALVAHHSHAVMTADLHGIHDLDDQFDRDSSLLADALVYADMHADPRGGVIPAEERLADIARRHTHPRVDERAMMLRASLRRVNAALARTGHASPRGAVDRAAVPLPRGAAARATAGLP